MKRIFTFFFTLFVASSVWAQNTWNNNNGTISIGYNKYGSDVDGDNKSDQFQAGNGNILKDAIYKATGNMNWIPSKGDSFVISLSGSADFSGVIKFFLVDEREEIGGYAALSHSPESFYVNSGEFFHIATVLNVSYTTCQEPTNFEHYGEPLTSADLVIAIEPDVTSSYSGWSTSNKIINTEYLQVSKSIQSQESDFYYAIVGKNSVEVVAPRSYSSSDYVIPATVGNYNVTSIATDAFDGCTNIRSVTIPASVTSIGAHAFYECASLTSVTILGSITSMGYDVFEECPNLASITIADGADVSAADLNFTQGDIRYKILNGKEVIVERVYYSSAVVIIPDNVTYFGNTYTVTKISGEAFNDGSKITSITLPNGITTVGDGLFNNCNNLTYVSIPENLDMSSSGLYFTKDDFPYKVLNSKEVAITEQLIQVATKGSYFESTNCVYVEYPMGEYSRKMEWKWDNNDRVIEQSVYYTCNSKTLAKQVYDEIKEQSEDSDISEATVRDNKVIVKYVISGETKKEDVIDIAKVIAMAFDIELTAEDEEYWLGESNAFVGEIVIPSKVTGLGNDFDVTSISESVFEGSTELTSITIPASVTFIGKSAFSGCPNLISITCMSVVPPTTDEKITDNYNVSLFVPCEVVEVYQADKELSKFKSIECISTESVEISDDEVVVELEDTKAVFSMPTNEIAKSYTLTIQHNGETFCTLTFNENGQLANIDFSTKAGTVQGFQFTVTGLSAATDYKYSFKALASNKSVLKEYSGSFTTKNEDGTGGSVQGGGEGTLDVEVFSNTTPVTIVNGQILVNGEAPAFVVTVSGQKIANENLKAGVYFVNVEGETVGVSVR